MLDADVSISLSTLVGFILPELKSCFLKALILSELSLTEAPVGPELLDIEIEAVEKMDEAVVESEADYPGENNLEAGNYIVVAVEV